MKNLIFEKKVGMPGRDGWDGERVFAARHCGALRGKWGLGLAVAALAILFVLAVCAAAAQSADKGAQVQTGAQGANLPPRVVAARRLLTQRGWTPARGLRPMHTAASGPASPFHAIGIEAGTAAAATWQPVGPTAVQTPGFGLVTGRVAALALDPSDPTGNRLYVGTSGGGVWVAQNAGTSNTSSVVFTPLTDALAALGGVRDASISIGALTVQPGGTGVILAGTGDPNDMLDSYYGAGILRSTDGGNTWSLIAKTSDKEQSLGPNDFSFTGEGFAGFAWSTVNPQLVVAAVSQAFRSSVVNGEIAGSSYMGLYYSVDSGATWHLATITDGAGNSVQGPTAAFAQPDGNAATSVVWNPVRRLFVAAVRYHGYYQSADGVTWTRMAAQPGAGLTAQKCPNTQGSIGSVACPIYRGTLAVNPSTGDTLAWTVDVNDQDQGLWQDQCAISGGTCGNASITFAQRWSTAALESNTANGAATIANGSYTLALAAVPTGLGAGQDTALLAGANDLWKCSLAMGCAWRNSTNSDTCKSAKVGEFQHALAWNPANPLEMFVGNDSGLWRSTDQIAEGGQVCAATDASHFQNLNGSLGSLAEVVSLAAIPTQYSMLAGLGVNGTAGIKASSPVADWPQILGGLGGPVAIDSSNNSNWYVNNQPGVAIYRCAQAAECTAADFGTSPVVGDADVGGDGDTMPTPAPFVVDPLDKSQLIVGTCRLWRGPAGGGWSGANAISPILDRKAATGSCSGDALISAIAAFPLAGGGERVYVGIHGAADGGASLAGHVLTALVNPASSVMPVWQDLTLNPVSNDVEPLNMYGMEISSIFIDPHDATGNTVYITIEGIQSRFVPVDMVYRSTDGGAHWADLVANLLWAPANSIVVDPLDAKTVYLATDIGVYFTTQVSNCELAQSNCWSTFGTGLPLAPVVALNTSSTSSGTPASPVLVAATYGRGIWQTALWTAGTSVTSAAASPGTLTFGDQIFGTQSTAQTVNLQNTGNLALTVSSIAMSADFSETDNCQNVSVAAGASCAIHVSFTPGGTGSRIGLMTVNANVYGGQLTVDLTGTGTPAGAVTLAPGSVDFGQVGVGASSALKIVQADNSGTTAIPIGSIVITSPFAIAGSTCGTTSLAANSSCQLQLKFSPTQPGSQAGTLIFTDGAGTQTVLLSGTGAAAPTDALDPTTLSFPSTAVGSLSTTQTVTLINGGDLALTGINVSVSGAFQTANPCGTQLVGRSACNISVVFAPTQLGTQTGTLTVQDALRTQTVALSGAGAAPPAFGLSPTSLSFSSQQPGVASAPQTVTVSNTGGGALANVGFQITGAAAASYSIGSTTCGATLTSGSCTVQVIFAPAVTGAIAATLTVSSSTAGVVPASVSLNGSGQLSSGLGGNPAQLTFPTVGVGQTSAAQPVTISNTSSYAVGGLTVAVNGPFSLSQNTCTGSLAAGASCGASVTFQPAASGAAAGALTVSSAGVASPANIALSGMGFDFTVAVSGTSSLTVAAGQTANYTVTITPLNGAPGSFSYTCGTLPANALCLFNPPTTTLSAGAKGSLTVQISTGKAGSASIERPSDWRLLPMLCGLVLLPWLIGRRRRAVFLVLLLVVFVGGVTSCTSSGAGLKGGSGGSGGSGSGSATPPGTYSIPVTFVSTGVSHSVTVTLTVD